MLRTPPPLLVGVSFEEKTAFCSVLVGDVANTSCKGSIVLAEDDDGSGSSKKLIKSESYWYRFLPKFNKSWVFLSIVGGGEVCTGLLDDIGIANGFNFGIIFSL